MQEIRKILEQAPCFELQTFFSEDAFSANHVEFVGIPNRHQYSEDRMVLVCGTQGGVTTFYEFAVRDIDRIETIETVVAKDGRALPLVRLWVRKGVLALRYEPFVVLGGPNLQVSREKLS